MAECSGEAVSHPAIFRLRVRFPSLPGHATLPSNGASVTGGTNRAAELNGRDIEISGVMGGNWPCS